MKLEKFKEDSYEFSKTTSELVRQFAFAGIGIIWIFKIDNPENHLLPEILLKPLLLLVITLGCDLLQYLIPSIIWSLFYYYHEWNGKKADDDLTADGWLTIPGWICFFAKTTSLIFSYYFIIKYLIAKL